MRSLGSIAIELLLKLFKLIGYRRRVLNMGTEPMRILRDVALVSFVMATQTSAQAADVLYTPAPHPHVHADHYYRHPAPPLPKFGWVLMPGIAYAPISPKDYSLATSYYYSRLWEPYPYCCPDPYYVPAIIP